ncbi:MAG: alpha-L-arabinofuranosidase [Candidatus Hydrogenedentes bacterium]|nr:alpha-L-arabinofuranosidase [Candidatus Hydrogenedentota bacterium]
MIKRLSRRALFKNAAKGIAAVVVAGTGGSAAFAKTEEKALEIDPQPRFELSRWLYMQFMEPLGTTDGSVAVAWDHLRNCWREDVIEVSRDLAPTLMRWGGCFSSYYRWKEGVGSRDQRQPMLNLLWGGIESNQVGTVEFIDFCRQIGADPLMCVNFESDGREKWMKDPQGRVRAAGPEEAAEWVAYCNDAGNPLRASHGHAEPCRIPIWQIGNETSYDRGGFDCETASRKTVEFARAMRKADPSIALIGWGDNGWAPRMIEVAGEDLQYIAFHHMYNPGSANDSPLKGTEYRNDPARTWDALMEAWKPHAAKILEMREQTGGKGMPLALTECHFALRGPERCHVLSTWAAGVAMARLLNVHTRNGDVLKIATAADFCGNRWQVNAVMIPDRQRPYMMPVARVMQLYRAHTGQQALDPISVPDELDVTASRTDNRVFVHVVNTSRTRAVSARLSVAGMTILSGQVFQIAADPEFEVWSETCDVIAPVRKELPPRGQWTFPAASVSVVELEAAADPAATQ